MKAILFLICMAFSTYSFSINWCIEESNNMYQDCINGDENFNDFEYCGDMANSYLGVCVSSFVTAEELSVGSFSSDGSSNREIKHNK
ncbi:hypothetical protein N9N67_00240 [Bacteriovoracaceae bacterium]|nr:hypothetical protein [Bacteriovoracaceae bacterium]